jgi:hypothetical protein
MKELSAIAQARRLSGALTNLGRAMPNALGTCREHLPSYSASVLQSARDIAHRFSQRGLQFTVFAAAGAPARQKVNMHQTYRRQVRRAQA